MGRPRLLEYWSVRWRPNLAVLRKRRVHRDLPPRKADRETSVPRRSTPRVRENLEHFSTPPASPGGLSALQHASGLRPSLVSMSAFPVPVSPGCARGTATDFSGSYARGNSLGGLAEVLRAAERSEAAC